MCLYILLPIMVLQQVNLISIYDCSGHTCIQDVPQILLFQMKTQQKNTFYLYINTYYLQTF